MVILEHSTSIKTGSRPVVETATLEKIHGASTAPVHQHKENTMHKVVHQVVVFYDWLSGPAMSEQERTAAKIAEANRIWW